MTDKLNQVIWICLIVTSLLTLSDSDDLASMIIASRSTTTQLYHLLNQSEISSKNCLKTIDYFNKNPFERTIFECK
jgi:hypothetical protein